MEIPPVVNLEGNQSWTASGLQKIATQELTSEISTVWDSGSADHGGDDCLPEAQSFPLEPDEDVHKPRKSFVLVSQNNTEDLEAVCLQEPEQVSVISDEAPPDQSPLGSSVHLHEAGIVFTSPTSNDSCCGNVPLPDPVAEGQSDHGVQNDSGQAADLNSGGVKTDYERLEPVSNGHVFRPPQDPILVPAAVPDSGRRCLDLPRIVKHKPSSITFSHYTFPSGTNSHAFVNESSDEGESSPEEEEDDHDDGDGDDDDDDVFPELPQSRDLLVNHRQRSKDKPKRRGAVGARPEIDHTATKCGYEAEEEGSSKEVSPQVKSPWSESMSQLMRKLDQLNLDIEEALSASSSPSDTPCTTRKKQWGAVSKSTLNQNLNHLQRPDRGECPSQDRSSAPRSSSAGTRATTKKMMFNKMTTAAGAGLSCLFRTPECSSAVLRVQAFSLTQGHCLLVEADCDLRQLQSLFLSLWRPV
ncbi:hypothetical protein D5F01_LYC06003 [Larimichthys crocea]|uniref:Uncharacterized protein n=1 Tax=Larimichthys crocea TaxID=215358 RepID=A0A6G0IU84_LARCR|nr:hypothetical protein D5F01_LYC06003 [Larimichthys crocea]